MGNVSLCYMQVHRVAFSPSGKFVLTISGFQSTKGQMLLWDAQSGYVKQIMVGKKHGFLVADRRFCDLRPAVGFLESERVDSRNVNKSRAVGSRPENRYTIDRWIADIDRRPVDRRQSRSGGTCSVLWIADLPTADPHLQGVGSQTCDLRSEIRQRDP